MSKIDLKQNNSVSFLSPFSCLSEKNITYLKAADLQMLKKKIKKKINGKYWPSYVQWRNYYN